MYSLQVAVHINVTLYESQMPEVLTLPYSQELPNVMYLSAAVN